MGSINARTVKSPTAAVAGSYILRGLSCVILGSMPSIHISNLPLPRATQLWLDCKRLEFTRFFLKGEARNSFKRAKLTPGTRVNSLIQFCNTLCLNAASSDGQKKIGCFPWSTVKSPSDRHAESDLPPSEIPTGRTEWLIWPRFPAILVACSRLSAGPRSFRTPMRRT